MHLLIATDGSAASVDAARCGADAFAPDHVTLLAVLTRVPGENVDDLDEPEVAVEQESRQWEAVTREVDREFERVAAVVSSPSVDQRVEAGDVSSTVVRVAKELGVDVIVLGVHEGDGHRHLFRRSIAERVVRDAPCTVLVVRMVEA